MKNKIVIALLVLPALSFKVTMAQCTIDTTNTTIGFTPHTPHVVKPGVAYAQTIQVYIPTSYDNIALDSLHIDSIGNIPAGINYVLNPASGSVVGNSDGAICLSGTTHVTPGLYTLIFYGFIYSGTNVIPISEVASEFSYSLKVETAPIAAFVADSPSCAGIDSVKLSDLTSGYPTSWNWKIPGASPDSSRIQNPSVVFDTAGTYTVTLIAKNSISADTITQTIVVNPIVNGTVATTPASSSTSADGRAVAVLSGGTPPFTYLWSTNAVTDTITGLLPGNYWVLATDAKGCGYVNDNVNVSYLSGIQTVTGLIMVKVYPNPTSDMINMQWPQKSSADISVYDVNGRLVRHWATSFEDYTSCNVRGLAPGEYVMRIDDKASNQQQAVIFNVVNSPR